MGLLLPIVGHTCLGVEMRGSLSDLGLQTLTQIVGAAFAASMVTLPSWTSGYNSFSVGGLIRAVLLEAGHGFGNFLTVIMALSVTANVAPTLYSFSLNLQIICPPLTQMPRYVFSVVATAILIPLSIVGKTRFYVNLYSFLGIVGYWTGLFASVVIVEHWLVYRGRWERYDVGAWDRWRSLPTGLSALGASVGSCALIWTVRLLHVWKGSRGKCAVGS